MRRSAIAQTYQQSFTAEQTSQPGMEYQSTRMEILQLHLQLASTTPNHHL